MHILILMSALVAGQAMMPARVVDAWRVEVGPGTVTAAGRAIELREAVVVDIAPPERVSVKDECHTAVPVFNNNTGGWLKGARLRMLKAEECSATGLLHPDSVRIKGALGGAPLEPGRDYGLDPFWGTFGRLEGGAITARQTLYADYDYDTSRLDTISVDASGKLAVVKGAPGIALLFPPVLDDGAVALVNVWVVGRTASLTEENLFPIDYAASSDPPPAEGTSEAEQFLPKTLAKLRAGQPVTIVAFGDSVTDGGGAARAEDWYQNQFAVRLHARFPASEIRVVNAGWGGASSRQYLDAPAGGPYDFARDVLEPKADLVTIEFVNDAYLDETGVEREYSGLVGRIRETGAEVALLTPHLVRPDWMKLTTLKVTEDPRAYVRGLRLFAQEHAVALADGSRRYCDAWRTGIPYMALMANNINHPDARGHALFAEALMAMFPQK